MIKYLFIIEFLTGENSEWLSAHKKKIKWKYNWNIGEFKLISHWIIKKLWGAIKENK